MTLWNKFVDESPHGTIFSNYHYLQGSGVRYKTYFVFRGEEIKCGLVLTLNDNEEEIRLDDLIVYNGIMFNGDKQQKESSARLERFEITEFIIDKLVKKFDKIEFTLAPQFEDIRPFSWHNYHSQDQCNKLSIKVRYTSYLNTQEFIGQQADQEMQVFKNMERLRRRRVKEGLKIGAKLELGDDTDILIKYYKMMLNAQDITPSDYKLNRMAQLVNNLCNNKIANMFFVREENGEISYVIVFGFDSKRAYALFAAGNQAMNVRHSGTFAYWGAFKFLADTYGITEVDLEGVNSPKRGWFKISFGGSLIPYYEITL